MNGEYPEKKGRNALRWKRYVARLFDYALFSLILWFILGFILSFIAPSILESVLSADNAEKYWLGAISAFIWVFVETWLLSSWGNTPGKWFLRIKLSGSAGNRLTFSEALHRSFSVWVRGVGLGLPIVSIVTLILASRRLHKEGITTWDREGGFVVSHKAAPIRTTMAIFFLLAMLLLLRS